MGCFGGQEIPIPAYEEPFEWPEMPEFGGIEMPEMPEFPEPYDPTADQEKARRAEEVRKIKDIEMRRKGYKSTLLTGGAGDETEPVLRRPSLLGS